MRRKLGGVAMLLAVVSGCGETDSHVSDTSDIIGGSGVSGEPAVVAITRNGSLHCTGTLVTSRLVLTAAHCLSSWDVQELRVVLHASDTAQLDANAKVVEPLRGWVNPRYDGISLAHDLAVIELPEPENIAPVPVYLGPLSAEIVGLRMRLVGFGKTSPSERAGRKLQTTATIMELEPGHIVHEAKTCPGDSGGPGFLRYKGVTTLFGVHSSGSCGQGVLSKKARLDVDREFLEPFLEGSTEPLPVPSEPSVDATAFGEGVERRYTDPDQQQDIFGLRCPPDKPRLRLEMSGNAVDIFLRHEQPVSQGEHDLQFQAPVQLMTDSETPPGTWNVLVVGDAGLAGTDLALHCGA